MSTVYNATICFCLSIPSIDGIHRILVATSEGALYVGNIDPRDGGECRIAKEYRLFAGQGDVPQDEGKVGHVSHPWVLSSIVWDNYVQTGLAS